MKDRYDEISEEIEEYQSKGYRVLLMAESGVSYIENNDDKDADDSKNINGKKSDEDSIGSIRPFGGISPIGYIVLSNPIRENAESTFTYFKEQALP